MLFTKPIPFAEAIASRKAKRILPTTAGSRELAELGPDILNQAMFSAKVTDMGFLAQADRLINGLVSPLSSPGGKPGRKSPLSEIEARAKLQDYLDSIKYQAPKGKEGTLQDLRSSARIDLIMDMGVKNAQGFGQETIGNDPNLIDDVPCWEFLRVYTRKNPRGGPDDTYWKNKWVSLGGKMSGGRMIARKDDPIWTRLSEFGNPWPPYDYNSGWGRESVTRREAEELGVIKPSDIIKPKQPNLNENTERAFPTGISSGLADVLQQVFTVVAGRIILEGIQ